MDWVFKDKMQSILLGRQWLQSLISKENFILNRDPQCLAWAERAASSNMDWRQRRCWIVRMQ